MPDQSPQDAVAELAMAEPAIRNATWVIWLDADEFLYIPLGRGHIGDLVSRLGPADAIGINWRNFGDSGMNDATGGLVLETFHMATSLKFRLSRTVKTLFRMDDRVKALYIHRPLWHQPPIRFLNGEGQPLDADFVFGEKKNGRPHEMVPKTRQSYSLAQINHYAIKSLDRVALKQLRGNGLTVGATSGRFGSSYLRRFNRNEEDDRAIQVHLPDLRNLLESALSDAGVRNAFNRCRDAFAAQIAQVQPIKDLLAADRTGQADTSVDDDG